jgi:hypothetical protein
MVEGIRKVNWLEGKLEEGMSEEAELLLLRTSLQNMKTMNGKRMVYAAYLRSKWWKRLRIERITMDGGRCTECGSVVELQVHHEAYPGFGKETLADVKTICRACHQAHTKVFNLGRHVAPKKVPIKEGHMFKTFGGDGWKT